jgi:NTP pyrophosphatase (non-canonical NTP hydrolase)
MDLNTYQERAMTTCMESSNNFMYMLSGLTAEVGEINDKVAKGIRKGYIKINYNGFEVDSPDDFIGEVAKEISDVMWFVAGLSKVMGYDLEEIGRINLEKLASRKERGVIDGNGDNR